MASLRCLAKYWWTDGLLQRRLKEDGLKGLVVTAPGKGMASKDDYHVVQNRRTLEPIIRMMREQHMLKTPYLQELEDEVASLALVLHGKPLNPENLAQMHLHYEVDIHVICSSIKRMLSFLRRRLLLWCTARDIGGPFFFPFFV